MAANPASVLIADDDPSFVDIMSHHLRTWSYRVESASNKRELLLCLERSQPDILLLDVRLGEHHGLEILPQLRSRYPELVVVMLTAFGSIESAISAVKVGAVDYLTKPVDVPRLRNVIQHALASRPQTHPSPTSAAPTGRRADCSRPILGESPAVLLMASRIERIAASDATVLISGESGTGKELAARAVHELSARRDAPFVPLNVAALPRDLVESTLFGHAKGAFTGADKAQIGCCEAAQGGTLFLDEIGEMEVGLQAKLLRFLQEQTFFRVGESRPITVNVRIVAATNRDPRDLIRRGLFREDLYYRLNVVRLSLPPLRERTGDIPRLVEHFRSRFATRCSRRAASFSAAAIDAMARHSWPGNIRELENTVERILILNTSGVVDEAEVAEQLDDFHAPRDADRGEARPGMVPPDSIDQLETRAIVEALASTGGNVRQAASRLGIGKSTIYRKMKNIRISPGE